MKSSVTNRKQRFWALLLAVVMVVGLLPTAGVKAETIPISSQNDLENMDKTIIQGDDLLSGGFRSQYNASTLDIIYLNANGQYMCTDQILDEQEYDCEKDFYDRKIVSLISLRLVRRRTTSMA